MTINLHSGFFLAASDFGRSGMALVLGEHNNVGRKMESDYATRLLSCRHSDNSNSHGSNTRTAKHLPPLPPPLNPQDFIRHTSEIGTLIEGFQCSHEPNPSRPMVNCYPGDGLCPHIQMVDFRAIALDFIE